MGFWGVCGRYLWGGVGKAMSNASIHVDMLAWAEQGVCNSGSQEQRYVAETWL